MFALSNKCAFLHIYVKVFPVSQFQDPNSIKIVQNMILGYCQPNSLYWFKKWLLLSVIIVTYIIKWQKFTTCACTPVFKPEVLVVEPELLVFKPELTCFRALNLWTVYYQWLGGGLEFYIHCTQVEMCAVHSVDAVGKNMCHRYIGSTSCCWIIIMGA